MSVASEVVIDNLYSP